MKGRAEVMASTESCFVPDPSRSRELAGMMKSVICIALVLLCVVVSADQGNHTRTWDTLNGSSPLVIARGGFSGIYPDSSQGAYQMAALSSLEDVIMWCDVQLTREGVGICLPDINLNKTTDFKDGIYKYRIMNYSVNGVPTLGYFSVDYTLRELYTRVSLIQGDSYRTDKYDHLYSILTVDEVVEEVSPRGLWLNIQHDLFYSKHNLSMKKFALSACIRWTVDYISSPEVSFLRGIRRRIDPKTTKLVFRFLEKDEVDPSINKTYGSLLEDLKFIKGFASGILVPKAYIWPVEDLYLQPHTSLISDAHEVGLKVFASGFTNDVRLSFNYSYDPLAEYLQFIDNGEFSVDGVLSDFPITPSAAIGCFAHTGTNAPKKVNTLVISKYGASGDYPVCTDLAYEKAISDGADIIDCPVQMSKDGVPFCLSSIDLSESTAVLHSRFSILLTSIPEIKSGTGVFTFNMTWEDIKSLTPTMSHPYAGFRLSRNPKYNKNLKLLTLSEFLNLTKNRTSLSGVMIIIENAAYLAKEQNLSVTDAVMGTLSRAGYNKPGALKVMIQSTHKSVLLKFKETTNYELVYKIDEIVGNADDSAVSDIKSFADSVVLKKEISEHRFTRDFILTVSTKIVSKLKSSNLSVYMETFSNEFVSQAFDFMSDATVEINSFVQEGKIDGVITDFPKTANRYRRNKCLNMGDKTPLYMDAPKFGAALVLIPTLDLPPPLPSLTEAQVEEVAEPTPAPQPSKNDAQAKVVYFFLSTLIGLACSSSSAL